MTCPRLATTCRPSPAMPTGTARSVRSSTNVGRNETPWAQPALAFSPATDENWGGAYRWAALIAGALLAVLCLVGLLKEVSRLMAIVEDVRVSKADRAVGGLGLRRGRLGRARPTAPRSGLGDGSRTGEE